MRVTLVDKEFHDVGMNEYIIRVVNEKKPDTVEQLLKLIKQKWNMPEQEIIEHILRLQNEGKLVFKSRENAPPFSTRLYLFSADAAWYWVIVSLTLASAVLVFTIPEEAFPMVYARYILGSVFVLWSPGYCLIKVMFPTKELDIIERIALSIGMSLAIVPLTGLLLNYTPFGIRPTPITLSLLALTLALATVGIVREHQDSLKEHSLSRG